MCPLVYRYPAAVQYLQNNLPVHIKERGMIPVSYTHLVDKYHPDRILIEPSGVGKLSDVIKAVQGVQGDVDIVLNSYTTVVDAKKCKMYMRNFGEFFNNQVEYAGAIIMSRTDIIDEKKAQQAMELLRGINAKAAIITTPRCV